MEGLWSKMGVFVEKSRFFWKMRRFWGVMVENWGFGGKMRFSGVLVEKSGFFRKMGFWWVFDQEIGEK